MTAECRELLLKHHHHGLSQKLKPDVPLTRANSPPQAILEDTLIHRPQHDVHHPNSPDSECQRADKQQQYLQADRQAVNYRPELLAPEHLDCFLVSWRELLPCGDRRQHLRLSFLFKLRSHRLKDQHLRVTYVPQIARHGERNEHRAVVAGEVVRHLQLAVHHADDREAHAADLYSLTHGVTPAEQLLLYAAAEKRNAPALDLVRCVNPPALARNFVAHLAVFRANAADRRVRESVAIGYGQPLHCLQAGMLD